MPQHLFLLGSPRSRDAWQESEPSAWAAMPHSDMIEVAVSLQGRCLMVTDSPWSELLHQYDAFPAQKQCCLQAPEPVALKDVLSAIGMQCGVNIRIEDGCDPRSVVELIHEAIYRSGWSHTQFLVSARRCRMLSEIRAGDTHIRTGLVVGDTPHYCAELAREAQAYCVHIDTPFVTAQTVRRCHEYGIMVIAHEAHDAEHIASMAAAGVDGIATRYPARFLRWAGTPGRAYHAQTVYT